MLGVWHSPCINVLLGNAKNIEIRKLRGLAAIQIKHWKDAKEDFEYLLKNDPEMKNHFDYYLSLAEIYESNKKLKSAQDMRDKAAEIQRKYGIF